jgi:hypothetical protein
MSQTITVPNSSAWSINPVTVATSGTPVQGPSVAVPSGAVAIQASTANGNKKLRVANSSANTADVTKRIELKSGESLNLNIDSLDLLWFDSSGNNTVALIVAEV